MENETHTCDKCGAKIIWIKSYKGRNVMLDAKPIGTVWTYSEKMQSWFFSKEGYRCHWDTCTHTEKREFKPQETPQQDNPDPQPPTTAPMPQQPAPEEQLAIDVKAEPIDLNNEDEQSDIPF